MAAALNGERFIEDDFYKISFTIKNGHLVNIGISIKEEDYFPRCNAENKQLLSGWFKWINSQIHSALMQAPTTAMEEKIGKAEIEKAAIAPTRKQKQEMRPIFTNPPIKEVGETASGAKAVSCPNCGADIMVRKKCCGNKGWEGICQNCRNKIVLPEI